MQIKISEIYQTLIGESTYSGMPCILIRLGGCNLNCSYCDTKYAKLEYNIKSFEEIRSNISNYYPKLILLTGGEPLFQDSTPSFISFLKKHGYKILLETNGSLDISILDPDVIKIMDIKCPSSGEYHKNRFLNIDNLTQNDEIKFVIGDNKDFLWAISIIEKYHLIGRFKILFSPVTHCLSPQCLAKWILEKRLDIRLQLQLHKIIWGNKRGV